MSSDTSSDDDDAYGDVDSDDTSDEDESSDVWSKSKYKTPTAKSSDSDESEKKSTGVKGVAPPKKPAKRQETKKKKPPPLTQEEIEIKKLIDSGDVDDKREAELALRLMNELHCLRKHALIAAHCDNWTKATACVDDLILKDEFIKLRVAEKKAGIAVDLWKQSIVDSKKAAADLANRFSSVKEVLKHLNDEKEKKKKLRRLQANYDLTTEDECLAVVELMAKRHSEEDSVEAVRAAGVDGAEDYLEKLDRNQKTIRRLISNYNLSRAKCLSVIELMELNCDEDLAAELIEKYDEKEAKAEWQRLMRTLETPQVLKKYKEVKKSLKFKRLVLALNLIEFGYSVKDVLMAAKCCTTVNEALTIIDSKRECTICFDSFTANDLITLSCQHEMCRDCAVEHFTVRIREHNSVYDVVCPKDGCGDELQKLDHEYFIMLSNQLQELLNKETYELFQSKLFDHNMQKDELFMYCTKCSNGFVYPPGLESATCLECKHVMCPKCKVDWEPNHNGRTCDEVKELENTEKVNQLATVAFIGNKLQQNGIQCPKCKYRIELTRGDRCMHLKCTQCKHEFCEGCSQEMFRGFNCKVFADCTNGGLHAHHPRNCSYYVFRDFSERELESLFKLSKVEIPASIFEADTGHCRLIEGDEAGVEEPCGRETKQNHKGFCDKHYKEHLVLSINALKLDPAYIMDANVLTAELRNRNRKDVPDKLVGEADDVYRTRLLQAVIAEVPLDFKWKNRE